MNCTYRITYHPTNNLQPRAGPFAERLELDKTLRLQALLTFPHQ